MVRSSIKNLFPGVNPHLNSRLQLSDNWSDFHGLYLSDIRKTLAVQLQPLGYTTRMEKGIQIQHSSKPPHRLEPDVVVLDPDPVRAAKPFSGTIADAQELVLPAVEILAEEAIDYHLAVKIYSGKNPSGKPVVWLELLSPTNKPRSSAFHEYQKKRLEIVLAGIVFVEVDFLHQTPPAMNRIPSYPDKDPGSAPYRITIIDPRPAVETAEGRSRLFRVADKMPAMDIPLNDGDMLKFDFGVPYQKTFEEAVYGTEIDYSELPVNFDTYNMADQAYITHRMTEIAALPEAQSQA